MEKDKYYGQLKGVFSEEVELLSLIGENVKIEDIGIQSDINAFIYINNKEFLNGTGILQLFKAEIYSLKIKSNKEVIIDYKIKSYN